MKEFHGCEMFMFHTRNHMRLQFTTRILRKMPETKSSEPKEEIRLHLPESRMINFLHFEFEFVFLK